MRWWEVPGTGHIGSATPERDGDGRRDGVPGCRRCRSRPRVRAALHALQRWLDGGTRRRISPDSQRQDGTRGAGARRARQRARRDPLARPRGSARRPTWARTSPTTSPTWAGAARPSRPRRCGRCIPITSTWYRKYEAAVEQLVADAGGAPRRRGRDARRARGRARTAGVSRCGGGRPVPRRARSRDARRGWHGRVCVADALLSKYVASTSSSSTRGPPVGFAFASTSRRVRPVRTRCSSSSRPSTRRSVVPLPVPTWGASKPGSTPSSRRRRRASAACALRRRR